MDDSDRMGLEVSKTTFTEEERESFRLRLDESLGTLREVLARPDFGVGPRTLGAELELFLMDAEARPLPANAEVRALAADPRLVLELSRFNLELNLDPLRFEGRPFSALRTRLDESVGAARRAAQRAGARIAVIGILPTLSESHLGAWALTEGCRYTALSQAAQRTRGAPFHLRIEGEDSLDLETRDVSPEGANTSFQLHLRVKPGGFANVYNAAQMATAAALAVSGNSPFFLGRRLWEETRIALFTQAVDDRPSAAPGAEPEAWRPTRVSFGHGWLRQGVEELFAESVAMHPPLLAVMGEESPTEAQRAGRVPKLSELRLHHGTVWRWNRGVYDPSEGGHLRIELRALPAGPTSVDMAANAAFLIGLTLGIAPEIDRYLAGLTFEHARRNFYLSARHGLAADLLWPSHRAPSPARHPARRLVGELLPLAREGLLSVGLPAEEADTFLSIIEARAKRGLTAAQWQRRTVAAFETKFHSSEKALARMLEAYAERSEGGRPVHEWEVPRS